MRYVFGDYTLDQHCDELRAAGSVVRLDRQVFAVLAYLVQHHDRVVRRQELFEHLWPERYVSDAALERCIAVARRAVGDSGRTQHSIQTVHGRGYRFVAAVEERRDVPPETAASATPRPAALPEARPPPVPEVAASPAASTSPLPPAPHPPSPPLAAADRRQVTVLCATLAHATALADRLGLEAFQPLVQTFHSLARACVQRYEGTVQALGEEGVLALFGVPVAQEEHAWRAVRAALELQQRLQQATQGCALLPGEALTARVGVHTGWVVAGSRRDESPQAVVVGGDTTQGAMHVQALAAPGTVVVSETTRRQLHATVHSAAAGLVQLPGHTDPLMAYAVQGLDALTTPRVWSPFVGRQRELAVFDDLLARVLAGQGQVVGLIGEPGIGKSRLLAACRQRLPDRPVTVLEGYCRSYDHLIPYGPVCDLLQHQCGLNATAPPDAIATQVAQLLRTVGLTPEDSAPYLLQILGSPAVASLGQLPPDVIKEHTFTTLRQVHLRSSQQQPLLLIVENLHWIDSTSEAYLAFLVEQLTGVPLLLLTTYRPGYRPLWMDKSYATQLTLPRLTQEESRTIVRAVLPPAQHGEVLVQRLLARAQGNPLFLEEVAHAVREQGSLAADTPVPETIQAVLAARIDRLPLEAKHLLHTAAVIGTEVPVPLLAAIAELPEEALHRSLAHLQAAEFLYETRLVPEHVYTFKHALTHEVAYGSLLQQQQRFLHARIVDTLEALAPDRLAEGASGPSPDQVERLAHHAFRGAVWDKALTYSRQTGANAAAHSAYREASAAFEQAIAALQQLPDSRDTREQAIDLRFALRNALLPLAAYGRITECLREAQALAEALGDQRRLGWVLAYMALLFQHRCDYDGALESGHRARALAAALGDRDLQVATDSMLGQLHSEMGAWRRAVEYFRSAVAVYKDNLCPQRFDMTALPAVQVRSFLAACLAALGTFTEGIAHAEEAVRIAAAIGQPLHLILAYLNVGGLYLRKGDSDRAIGAFEQSRALCQDAHIPILFIQTTAGLGAAYTLAGRVAEAIPLLEQAVEHATSIRFMINHSRRLLWLSGAYMRAGRMEDALSLAERARDLAQETQEWPIQAGALRLLGQIYAHGDPPDAGQAEAFYRQALALAEELGMRPLQAHCHCGLGILYAKIGQREQARTALSTAIALYRAMEMTFWLPQAEAALVQVA